MNKPLYEKDLDMVEFGYGNFQAPGGLWHDDDIIGGFYIHQITIKRDINDRYEPVYSIKYDDYIFNETKLIEDKTFSELVNFIDKQNLIIEKRLIEIILLSCINDLYDLRVNGMKFIIKEKHDFEKEGLPMKKI